MPAGAAGASARSRAGLPLIVVGAILFSAAPAHTAFIDLPKAGFILVAVGLIKLWLPVRNKRALLQRQFRRVMDYLAWGGTEAATSRYPLTDLLDDKAPDTTTRQLPSGSSPPVPFNAQIGG